MLFVIFDRFGKQMDKISEGSINTQGELVEDINLNLNKGEHIIKLVDTSNKLYAQEYINVLSADIVCKDIMAALDLLTNTKRLVATLRS